MYKVVWQKVVFYNQSYQFRAILVLISITLLLNLAACEVEQANSNKLESAALSTITVTLSNSPKMPTETLLNSTPSLNVSKIMSTTPTISTTPTAILTATNPVISSDWEYRWLKGIPCQAPCFEGIIPGRTNAQEAFKLLTNNPFISDVKNKSSSYLIGWKWITQKANNGATEFVGYSLYDRQSTNLVIAIRPNFSTSFILKEIFNFYGEPSHIIANSRIDYDHVNENFLYDLTLIYLPQGFALTNYKPFTKPPIINSNLLFEDIGFFIPNKLESLQYFYPDYKLAVPWQGTKPFEYYCLLVDPKNTKCKGL